MFFIAKKERWKEGRKGGGKEGKERKKKKGRTLQTSGFFIAFLGKLGQKANKSLFTFFIYFKLLKYILNYFKRPVHMLNFDTSQPTTTLTCAACWARFCVDVKVSPANCWIKDIPTFIHSLCIHPLSSASGIEDLPKTCAGWDKLLVCDHS